MAKPMDFTKERSRILTDEDLEETETPEEETPTPPAEELEETKKKPVITQKITVTDVMVPQIKDLKVGDTIELKITAKINRKPKENTAELSIIDISTPTEELASETATPSPAPAGGGTPEAGGGRLAELFT